MRTGFTCLGAALALSVFASSAAAQTIKLTPQIGLGTLEQATPDPAFEARTLVQIDGMKASAVGSELFLLRKDRGPHAGRYAALITAPAGAGRNIMPFARTFPSVVSYQLIGADKLGPLPTVDVLGVHYVKIQPAKAAAFEKFVADKLNPAVGNLRPDLRFLYYKGPQSGQYILIIAITRASRDKYWPNGADSEDLKTAFTPAVRALGIELEQFQVAGSWGVNMAAQVYEAKEWADWVVVAR
jgi:hypothetical protein